MNEPHSRNEISGGTFDGPTILAGSIASLTVRSASASSDELGKTADKLAQSVRRLWQDEEDRRKIRDPLPLPVSWRTADEILTDHWENIRGVPAGESVAPLDLDGTLDEVSDVYDRVPSRRLVVLGRAGSGKTILALRLALELLDPRRRTPGDPVPVVFSLGSWDPTATSLTAWLTDRLIRDHPGLGRVDADGVTSAGALVEAHLVLPVLDGFDEIADGLHAAALEELSAHPRLPLVLTSRPEEYARAVAQTRYLSQAAAIEVTDLRLEDLEGYLPRTSAKASSPGATRWGPVLATLREHPDAPASVNLAAVLTTPLMVALARAVYSHNREHFPMELLDDARFGSIEVLEEHLLGSFIRSTYSEPRARRSVSEPRGRRAASARAPNPQRAERWLGALAGHMARQRTRDLAWWEIATMLPPARRALVIGVLGGLAFAIVTAVGNIPVDLVATSRGLGFAVQRGIVAGLLHGLAAGTAFGLGHFIAEDRAAQKPWPVRVRRLGGTRLVRPNLGDRVRWGVALGFAVALTFVLVDQLILPRLDLDDATGGGLVAGLALFPPEIGLAGGAVFALVAFFEAPVDVKTAVSPTGLLRDSRANVVVHLLAWGVVLGPEVGAVSAVLSGSALRGLQTGLVFAVEGAIAGGIGYGLAFTAWGQWLGIARIWLPMTGRLPWRPVAFLDDACRRGVLRQSGAVYQFRHARLQDHLIKAAEADFEQPLGPGRRDDGRRRSRAGIISVLAQVMTEPTTGGPAPR